MPLASYEIRTVVFRRGEWWIAQCLEYNLVATARKLSDLHSELDRLLIGHFVVARERGTAPFAGLPRAPQRFWDLFASTAERLETVEPRAAALAASLGMSPPMIETRIAA